MPTTRSKWMALAQLLVGGCASVFGAGLLIVPGQAQYVPPPAPPPPPPVFNAPSPDRTVPQPSYTPLSPSTPSTAPESSGPQSGASVAKRSIHHQHNHHHHRHRFAGYTLGSSYCGGSPCVRIRLSAFYEGPGSGLWWPGFYDYAEGQFARGRPRYGGASRPSGYHGD
jgi:hypothetical protein